MWRIRRAVPLVFALAITAGVGVAVPVGAQASSGWGDAQGIPGAGALNQGRSARVWSVSCPTVGDCAATGQYTDSDGHLQVFVVSEVNGVWGQAEELPGLAALNQGGAAAPVALSCASAGNCTVGGRYSYATGHTQAFVATETSDGWGSAEEAPGSGALNLGGNAGLNAVSCSTAGNCGAGGDYTDSSGHRQVFVISQVNGTWGQAEELPGSGTLNVGGGATLTTVSCPSAGDCVTGGSYTDDLGDVQAFLAAQTGGVWGDAGDVPGLSEYNVGDAKTAAVSCASAGNCTAVGTYLDGYFTVQSFVISENSGSWGTADKLPGTGGHDAGPGSTVQALSCSSVGDCSAGGYYNAANGSVEAFVDTQFDGVWRKLEAVPGVGTLGSARRSAVTAVSCASPGNCSAGGYFHVTADGTSAFVVDEVKGVWQQAEPIPGFGGGTAFSVHFGAMSCSPTDTCTAGGANFHAGGSQAYLVTGP